MRRIAPALFLSAALCLGGCSAGAPNEAQSLDAPGAAAQEIEVDADQVEHGEPAYEGWLDGAVAYCQEHGTENGVLVEVTGLMSQGFSSDTVQNLTLIMPSMDDERGEDWDPMAPTEVKPGDICADVYFAEPVEVTRWAHLMGVRGIATLDPAQENKIIIRGAIETDD